MGLDALIPIAVLLALAAPIGVAAAWFTSRGPTALGAFFRPDQGLGWPHGVQEEEPQPWNFDARADRVDGVADTPDESPPVAVEPVSYRLSGPRRDR